MSPRSSQPKRNRKRPRVDSDPDEAPLGANAGAASKVTSTQGLEEALPSQSSHLSPLRRSARLRRTKPNPDPDRHGEVLVHNASQISQASSVLVDDPASQSSRPTLTKSPTHPTPSTGSKSRKKPKLQKEAVKDRTVGKAESGTGDTKVPELVTFTPHSTSTPSLAAPVAVPSHVATTHPLLSAVTSAIHTPSNTVLDSLSQAAATTSDLGPPSLPTPVNWTAASPFPTFIRATEYVGIQDHTRSVSSVQLSTTDSSITAGRDFASGNISQHGQGNVAFGNSNEFHIHNGTLVASLSIDEHQTLMSGIRESFEAYIASEATLSKKIHGDPSLCYQGTRENLLSHIVSWVGSSLKTDTENDPLSRAICIVGAPGSGKSTIMNTLIVQLLDEAASCSPGLISAHYCIRRSLHSTTDVTKIFPTIILQLCKQHIEVAERVSQLLTPKQQPGVFHPDFLEQVFVEAVKAHGKAVFVIIDALDEASKPATLAAILSRVIPNSPANLRLLLATRTEHGVLENLGGALVPGIVYEIPTEESIGEVGRYIARRLQAGVKEIFGDSLAWSAWPDNSQLQSLSGRASGLFVWARTAVDFILSRVERRGEVKRDQVIQDVGRVGMADVNTLYIFILRKSLPEDDMDEEDGMAQAIERIKGALGFITFAEHPLPLDDIVGFLGYEDFDVRNFVRLARSILISGVQKITGATIPQIHKTFFDFVTSHRALEFRIEVGDVHRSTASRCFELMDSKLRFNICGLRSSFSLTDGLGELVGSVPKGLIYASTSWWFHLTSTQRNGESQLLCRSYLPFIRTLLYEKLLFWLEIVSLSKKEKESAKWIKGLSDLLGDNELSGDTNEVGLSIYAKDASLFIKRFSTCIRRSIPHIYISLLAFSPGDSTVANHYRERSATAVIPHPPEIPPQLEWSSWDTDADSRPARSVSFSPCGRRLAVGYSTEIRVWDVETGECGKSPFEGHSGVVCSVCFSPKGLLIASGSWDQTIRIWDAETGKCVLGPLTGHTDFIFSVSFSPDGSRIASGSKDCTIRVWDAHTGDCVLGPLKGHRDIVNSVAYAPDGLCIASVSNDATVRLWNAQTGEYIGGPVVDHEYCIKSLSFHPDGRRLVSNLSGHDLQIWDIQKSACTHPPLIGSTYMVQSVSFSPTGRYIASASDDRTIRIWDAESALCVAGPVGSISGRIFSVAFSPDERYLAAASEESVFVRLWDFKALLSAGPLESFREDEGSSSMDITDRTRADWDGWTLGPKEEKMFRAPLPFRSSIWQPSTVRILGRPEMIKPDLSNLVTGEEWLQCFPSS